MKKSDKSKNHEVNQAVKGYIESQTIEDIRWAETLPALKSVEEGILISAKKYSHGWKVGEQVKNCQNPNK